MPTMRPGMSACLLCCTAAMLGLTGIPCLYQAARRRRNACNNSQTVLAVQLHPHFAAHHTPLARLTRACTQDVPQVAVIADVSHHASNPVCSERDSARSADAQVEDQHDSRLRDMQTLQTKFRQMSGAIEVYAHEAKADKLQKIKQDLVACRGKLEKAESHLQVGCCRPCRPACLRRVRGALASCMTYRGACRWVVCRLIKPPPWQTTPRCRRHHDH